MSRRRPSIVLLLGLAGLLLVAQASLAIGNENKKILQFDTMVGVQGAFVGPTMPIRTVPGGGVAWTLEKAHGKLTMGGHLDVKVDGLVLTSTGSNPISSFRAIVSCLDSTNAIVNLMTDPFPATTGLASEGGGDAHIKADVALPQPCFAPIVFVTSPGGSWFAVTGG